MNISCQSFKNGPTQAEFHSLGRSMATGMWYETLEIVESVAACSLSKSESIYLTTHQSHWGEHRPCASQHPSQMPCWSLATSPTTLLSLITWLLDSGQTLVLESLLMLSRVTQCSLATIFLLLQWRKINLLSQGPTEGLGNSKRQNR